MKESFKLPDIQIHDIDLMLIGHSKVGKTALIQNFLFGQQKHVDHPGYFWDGYLLKYKFNEQSTICTRIFDTVGDPLQRSYICQEFLPKINPSIILYCYSITDRASFQDLKWRYKLISQRNIETPTKQVFALKLDISDQQPCRRLVTYQEGKQFANSINSAFTEISALNKQEIDLKFYDLFFIFRSQPSTKYYARKHTKAQIPQDNFSEMCSELDERQCECQLF